MRIIPLVALLSVASCRDDAACKAQASEALSVIPVDTSKAAVILKRADPDCADEPYYKHAAGLLERLETAQVNRVAARENERKLAWYAAEQYVENSLRAPGTARFADGTRNLDRHVRDVGNGLYEVSGWVDAQNSFGALLRSDFVVSVRRVDGGWELDRAPVLTAR